MVNIIKPYKKIDENNIIKNIILFHMGGNTFKTIITVRKNLKEYKEIKEKVTMLLKSKGIVIHFIPELSDKESFGDLDILYSPLETFVSVKEIIIELFTPHEIVSNGDILSFAFYCPKKQDFFQIDIIKCTNIPFAQFYFAYSDFGGIMGSITKRYGIIFGHDGLFIEYNNKRITLTENVSDCCNFFGIDMNIFNDIKTKKDLFDFIISFELYNKNIFNSGNHDHRKRIAKRPIYLEFLKYIGVDIIKSSEENDIEKISKEMKEKIYNHAIIYFDKQSKIDDIIKTEEKNNIIHKKFNGNMLKDKGYTGKELGHIIITFKNKYSNFDEFIYNSSQEDILKSLNHVISNLNFKSLF